MKIDLNTEILNLKTGKAIETETPRNGMTESIRRNIVNYNISTFDTLKVDLKMWQEKLGEIKKHNQTVRDYLLILLSQRIKASAKESFWVTEIGMVCSNEKNKFLDLEDKEEQFEFLKKLVENNKIEIGQGAQVKEIDLFFAFEQGQLLMALKGKKLDNVKEPVEPTKIEKGVKEKSEK